MLKNKFGTLTLLFAVFTTFALVIRMVLLVKSLPNLDLSAWLLLKIFLVGFLFDLATFAYFAIPFAAYTVLVPDRVFNHRFHRVAVYVVFFLVLYLLLFDAVAEYVFFDEFSTRFNFIAVDYLIYTHEVFDNIRESYPLKTILGGLLLLTGVLFLFVRNRLDKCLSGKTSLRQTAGTACLFLALPLASYSLADLSYTHISGNSYANELAGDGIYGLFAAFKSNELNFNRFYVSNDEHATLSRLYDLISEKGEPKGLTRRITAPGKEHKLNVIVIVEESLGSDYIGYFGCRSKLTPNIDALANQSLLFTHFYATGTRTVRGLEALNLSIPPLPGTSLVKRPENENFFSWGSVMRDRGYDTKFIYAGFGYFDNMNYFFAHNGFDTVDRSNFSKEEITFSNAWGVCDEDLFNKVISEADKSDSAGKPFFSMVMTTSNHRPYTYPAGRIDIPSKTGRDGAVKYADYSIGHLIREAQRHPWFRNTIFVIVADHCASSAGKMDLPVKRYEIPLLIYSPANIKPAKVDTLASQVDVAPTVLGLLNISYDSHFLGRDILKTRPEQERAFISTYQKLGYLTNNSLVVLGPQKYLKEFSYRRADGAVTEIKPARKSDIDDALAYFQGIACIYRDRLNRISR